MALATPILSDGTIRHLMQCGILDPTTGEINYALVSGLTEVVDTAYVTVQVIAAGETCATGDLKNYYRVPAKFNGWTISDVNFETPVPGTTGTMELAMRQLRAGSASDILTTKAKIQTLEYSSSDGTVAVIDAAKDDVVTGDFWLFDIDSVHTTPAEGASVTVKLVAA